MDLALVSKELKDRLVPLYGERFSRLLLYGSYARSDFSKESDVDFMLILLGSEINPFKEIAKASPVLSELLFKYGKVVSLTATSETKFRKFKSPFYQTVKQEGIEIV